MARKSAETVAREAREARATQESFEPLPEVDAPDDAEQLARLLCQHNGENPDNFRMGKPRWEGYLFAARQHLVAFDFIAGLRAQEVNNGAE